MSTVSKSKYTTADSITVLEGLEPVRKRPGMYIGGVDVKALHHLVWEIVDNSVDEYINGYADSIVVTLHKNGDAVTVTDNGRGIPVDVDPKHKKPGVELILTTLHAGGKFGDRDGYVTTGGLNGVGSSVVNALSRKLIATIRRDGFEWEQKFQRGKTASALLNLGPSRGHGTTIYFEPDPEIFKVTKLDAELIRSHLEDMAYIHSGLSITFKNEATKETFELSHPGGIPEFLGQLVKDAGQPVITDEPFTLARKEGERIEVALQWTEATDDTIRSYVNGIRTSAGGTHEIGFRAAIVSAVRKFMKAHEKTFKDLTITAEDIREGIVGVLSVFVREPMFQGQTKEKLNNPEMTSTVENFVAPALETWLNTHPTFSDRIVGRIVMAARARLASREAAAEVKRKSPTQRRLNLPGKLADCKSTDLDETELFIVEGDSAGGSAKQGRNNYNQAVLPLRGKILNAEGLPTAKVLTNQELSSLVSAIGTGAGDKFNLGGLRYGKIILLMDADHDGDHIATLLLAFFFRHMTELIRAGRLFIAKPPLYRVDVGKKTHWVANDAAKDKLMATLPSNAKPEISRFKGLGEMQPAQLRETTLDPKFRTLLKVEIHSNLEADKIFVELLGKDPGERYRLIMDPATVALVGELDV
jgi:DNA gyrase/topoisomerase IV subunit B